MKNIGILNFQYSSHNYGAVLQAGALEFTLKEIGYTSKHIDFKAKQKNNLKQRLKKTLRKLRPQQRAKRSKARQQRTGNKEAFEKFRKNYISRTKRIRKPSEFTKISKRFDVIIVGSDQVWRPTYAIDPIAFFLGYVPDGIARVSYAASFGTSRWEMLCDTKLTNKVRSELSKFKAISCREDSGVDICRKTFKVEAVHVLDPLLLVNSLYLEKIISESTVKNESKLIYYKLDINKDFLDDIKEISNKTSRTATNIYLKNSKDREYQEVPDWLSMIYKSETVITDSYHCICLALRFNKEVIYCPNESRGQGRISSLLNKLDISIEPLNLELKTTMFKLVTSNNTVKKLEAERKKSFGFLSSSLNN